MGESNAEQDKPLGSYLESKIVVTKDRPPLLYKYQPLTPNVKGNLAQRQLWFSMPENFNDPFDCAIFPAQEVTALTWTPPLIA